MDFSTPSLPYMAVIFLIVITILVFVHEMGHYLVARLCGVRVKSFSIGFGREIYGWNDKHGTRWKVSIIPLGGYVKFFGDAGVSSNPDASIGELTPEERKVAFHYKPVYQRAAIVFAGPFINYLFAAFVFAVFFATLGTDATPPIVGSVQEGSPAEQAGMQPGDRVVSVDGSAVEDFKDIYYYVVVRPEELVRVTVERDNQLYELNVLTKRSRDEDAFGNKSERGLLGIQSVPLERHTPGVIESMKLAVEHTWDVQVAMFEGLKRIVIGSLPVDQLGGPLKIAKYSGEAASISPLRLVEIIALISISLGFMNLLPIPMLDGGHLAFYAFEAVRGRPVSARVQEYATLAGLALVLVFFVFVTWNDLKSFGVWDKLSNLLS